MAQGILESQILKLLKLHAPVKAKKLASILSSEFGKHVDRSDINSALYHLKTTGKTVVDSDYCWSIVGQKKSSVDEDEKDDFILEEPRIRPEIKFTDEQQAIINLDPSQHLLIRGQAGSGKTTVLAARAGKIISALEKGSLLFLTYNTALSAYVKKSFVQAGMKGDIDIKTFHEWCRDASRLLGSEFVGWVDSKNRSEQLHYFIGAAQKEMGDHRLYQHETNSKLMSWWGDEIAWLFGQYITRLDEYLSVDRKGRGSNVRVLQEDKPYIWCVYELYLEWLEETRQEDYDNPAGLMLKTLTERGSYLCESLRYDHVLIDEVQDFDKSWLMAAVKIPRVSLSLAGDMAQKIYRRSFTWTSVGIQVQGGRSRRLSTNHRTTKQIMDVASYLLLGNETVQSAEYTELVGPKKNGPKVKKIIGDNPKASYENGYQWIAESYKRVRATSVAVVLPFSKQLYPAKTSLEKYGLTVKNAKGAALGNLSGGAVVTTYHQLKGLEFDHVVIMGLHDSQYPGRILDSIPEEDQAEEIQLMKRVLYVAMTRAKQSVTLIGANPFCRLFKDVPADLIDDITINS